MSILPIQDEYTTIDNQIENSMKTEPTEEPYPNISPRVCLGISVLYSLIRYARANIWSLGVLVLGALHTIAIVVANNQLYGNIAGIWSWDPISSSN